MNEIPTERELSRQDPKAAVGQRLSASAPLDQHSVQISFDWDPVPIHNCITFRSTIIRGGKQSSLEYEIDLSRLDTRNLEGLRSILSARQAGIDDGREIAQAISWLLDLSLQQTSNLDLHERQATVRKLLLIQ